MRDDVRQFAEKMSLMMDSKEREKGPINGEYSLQIALMNLEAQWGKMREAPYPRGDALRRILIHLANFAMIAESKVPRDKIQAHVVVAQVAQMESTRCLARNAQGIQCGLRQGHERMVGQEKHRLGDCVQPW